MNWRNHLLSACAGLALIVVLGTTSPAAAQTEMLTNGSFGSSTGWTEFQVNDFPQTFDYNYTADLPTGGAGGALRIQSFDGDNGGVYQALTLEASHKYVLSGVAKDIGSAFQSTWLEVYIGQTMPADGSDYTDNILIHYSTWGCDDWDDPFENACDGATTEFIPEVAGTYYYVIKSGANSGGDGDVVIDELSLLDMGLVNIGTDELVTNGGFGSSDGWTQFAAGADPMPTMDFANTTLVPTGGSSPALNLSSTVNVNGGVYQELTLLGGEYYILSGQLRDASDVDPGAGTGFWCEIYLGTTMPVDGTDYTDNQLVALNSWAGTYIPDFDGSFSEAYNGNVTTFQAPGSGEVTVYLVIKAGTGGGQLNVSVDEVSLIGTAPGGSAVGEWSLY